MHPHFERHSTIHDKLDRILVTGDPGYGKNKIVMSFIVTKKCKHNTVRILWERGKSNMSALWIAEWIFYDSNLEFKFICTKEHNLI